MLERLVRSQIGAHREVQRARVLLMAADGEPNSTIATTVAVSATTVKNWRERFACEGLKGLGGVRPGRGCKPRISQQKGWRDRVRDAAREPAGETHWSCRSMATAHGVSPVTVQRIWSARGIQPQRVETFKLSTDKHFEDKLVDIVDLYLNPPENAVVLCVDETRAVPAR